MNLPDKTILRQLGNGESIANVCETAGITRDEFNIWWRRTIEQRVPSTDENVRTAVTSQVEIERDRWGIPHIYADNDCDLFFGLGYAMAQDRLFQLDYLRRKGMGRLSEILGEEGLELDTIARIVGLNRIALAEYQKLTGEVTSILQAFSDGINALIEQSLNRLPIEFDLLDYQPEPWTPVDCLAIENEFRWYLTGRFPVIVIPELAKRALGEGAFYKEFLCGDADEESILHAGDYTPGTSGNLEPIGHVVSDPDAATGSNNWVIAGSRTTTGHPLVASDPHIAFEAVSCWYEAHLCGGSFHVAGMAYTGIPAIMFGRNERVAWGITNNICSLRDLYQEKTDPNHPGCFLFDGNWESATERIEEIRVRDRDPVSKAVSCSRNGPLVNEILPPPARGLGPVTLKWLGAYQGGWLTSMLAMNRSRDVSEFREALRPWHVPTFSLVIADVDGHIAFQSAGRIPVRKQLERGFRPGWDPEHQWQGLIPFESMPGVVDPPRGWIASANNRLAPNDYPHQLFGCWNSGYRARRIRNMIESRERLSFEDMQNMHYDTKSLRAERLVSPLIAALEQDVDAQTRQAIDLLQSWDSTIQSDSTAATLFNVFFTRWCKEVAAERFETEQVALMSAAVAGTAGRILLEDRLGWFSDDHRRRIRNTFRETLEYLTDRLGTDMTQWHWGRLHRMPLKHVLSARGELARLLDHGGTGVHGDIVTVCNTGSGVDWKATTGAGYRLITDLSSAPPVLMAIDGQSASGHRASAHYSDQLEDWLQGHYHEIPLHREDASKTTVRKMSLVPF